MEVALKYWFQEPNAGDRFARDVAERYLGPVAANADATAYGSTNVMLVGSIMHWCDRDTVVCGAGMISPAHPPPEMPRKIFALRGPRTRAELLRHGANVPPRYGDPGVLAPEFASSNATLTHEYGVVLHDADRRWERKFGHGWLRSRSDTLYIDVRQDAISVIDAINRCNVIFSSSLHGLVFAHALNKRALWVRCSDRLIGGRFKFDDYFGSLGVDESLVHCHKVEGAQALEALAMRAQRFDTAPLATSVRASLAEACAYLESLDIRGQNANAGAA